MPGVGPQRGDPPVEAVGDRLHRLKAQGGNPLGGADEILGVGHRERQHGRAEHRPVIEREPLLGGQPERPDRPEVVGQPVPDLVGDTLRGGEITLTGVPHGFGAPRPGPVEQPARLALAVDARPALCELVDGNHRQRHVRERGEVARAAARALAGDEGVDPRVQEPQEHVDDLGADARAALGEGVRPEQHRGPHHILVERSSDGGGVAHDQSSRELFGLADRDAAERGEAGRDAVDLDPALDEVVHHLAGQLDAPTRAGFERDGPELSRDLDNLLDGEPVPGDKDWFAGRHFASPGPATAREPATPGRRGGARPTRRAGSSPGPAAPCATRPAIRRSRPSACRAGDP